MTAGKHTPVDLGPAGHEAELIKRYNLLHDQRDALLAACEALVYSCVCKYGCPESDKTCPRNAARAAIAKARGEA